MVLELLEGGEIFSLSGGIIQLDMALHIMRELLKGVSYLHKLNIMHRDLKPENIVITRNASSVKTNKGPVIIFENIDSILEIAKVEDVFVIGGAEIYRLFMPYAENIFLTLVMGEFKGDTYFPSISESGWYKEYMRFNTEKANPYALAFCKFVRKEKQHYIS